MKQYDCIVIGGGASGLAAAISLGRKKKSVLIIEQCKELGKKLYVTGNGRCNFTNSCYNKDSYRGTHPEFAKQVYKQFTYKDTIQFMHSIGVLTMEKDGYYYPYTNQAKTVVQQLINSLPKEYITLALDRVALTITKKTSGSYHIHTSYGEYEASHILLATGGMASPSDKRYEYIGYTLAEQLGHHTVAPCPALCALFSTKNHLKWKGIRANASLCICRDSEGMEPVSPVLSGEVQFTDYGISGVPTFQLSRYAAKILQHSVPVYAVIDFFPQYESKELLHFFFDSISQKECTLLETLCGFLQEPLAKILIAASGLTEQFPAKQLKPENWEKLISILKHYVLPIEKTADFSKAQVTAGGVATEEIDVYTMESRYSKNAYIAGELLDIDGTCGGYNLQFAFATGIIAANAITSKE